MELLRSRLARKILVSVNVIVLLAVLIAIVTVYGFVTNGLMRAETLRVNSVAQGTVIAISQSLWDFQPDKATSAMTLLAETDAAFLSGTVLDDGGETFASHDTGKTAQIVIDEAITMVRDGQEIGVFSVRFAADHVETKSWLLGLELFAGGLVVFIVIAALMAFLLRPIIRGIVSLTEAMTTLSRANRLDGDIPSVARSDELGDMARALVVFRDNALKMTDLTAQTAAEQRHRAEEAKRMQAAEAFAEALKAKVDDISGTAQHSAQVSDAMQAAATTNSEVSTTASSGAVQLTAAISVVSQAGDRLVDSIQEIGSYMTTSMEYAQSAGSRADENLKNVDRLNQGSTKIGEIITIISDIASQTNLLALNATIEAARAGDAGKGFAVVANEVKNLASQTQKATDEISNQIKDVQGATETTVRDFKAVHEIIVNIAENNQAIAALLDRQKSTTSEIVRSVQEATGVSTRITGQLSHATAAADDNAQQAQNLKSSLSGLIDGISGLSSDVDDYVSRLRSQSSG